MGEIITFYSFKGGTGRSMAVANISCLLASLEDTPKRILMMDWDLEAPGLHRYFENKLQTYPSSARSDFSNHLGLIDFLYRLQDQILASPSLREDDANELFESLKFEAYLCESSLRGLFLLKAGRFDANYARRVVNFDWNRLHTLAPWLFRAFAEWLECKFDFILLDSRTGISDASGISTALMPRKLVLVFTPNNQNLFGALELVAKAIEYRRNSDDLRPLLVFPLVSRVEMAEPELRRRWRYGDTDEGEELKQAYLPLFNEHLHERSPIETGYQTLFEQLFETSYDVPALSLQQYFDEVQIQHVPRYGYGEEIAVLLESTDDRLSLARSYETFVDWLLSPDPPWRVVKLEENARELLKRSINRFRSGESDNAISDVTAAIMLDSKSSAAYLTRAIFYYEMNDLSAALRDANTAIKLSPKESHTYFFAGLIYRKMRRIKTALEYFDKALALEPDNLHFLSTRAKSLIKLRRYSIALHDMDTLVASEPENYRWYLERASIYENLSTYELALQDLDRVIAVKRTPYVLSQRAQVYMYLRRYEEALKDIETAIQLKDDVPDFYAIRARIFVSVRNYQQAMEDYKHALTIDPNNADVLSARAWLYAIMSDFHKSLAEYETANRISRSKRKHWLNDYALVLTYVGRFDEAIEIYRSELRKDRSNHYTKYNLAVAVARSSSPQQAAEEINAAIETFHKQESKARQGETAYGLAGLEAIQGNISKALALLEEAFEHIPEDAYHWAIHDTAWDQLRNESRFKALLARFQ